MKLGILFTGNYSWAGGLYYSLNIIKLLQNYSTSNNLTIIVIINNFTPKELIAEVQLKNIEIVDLDSRSILYKAFCKIAGIITKSNYRFIHEINSLNLDLIYPIIDFQDSYRKLNCKVIYWIYDFQHKFLPQLFTQKEIEQRDNTFREIVENAEIIVLSSLDAKRHLNKFYPNCKAKVEIYKFISLISKVPKARQSNTIIPTNYFIVCNQFWPHKNHMVVLKALAVLLTENIDIHIVFTGNNDEERNREYVNELKTFILENNLSLYVTFTGFISREYQVELMQNAKAVIQPSYFEGWSTVIEDAKALNKFLIVSDIEINREQVKDDVLFFEASDFSILAEHISKICLKETIVTSIDYRVNIEASKSELINLFKV